MTVAETIAIVTCLHPQRLSQASGHKKAQTSKNFAYFTLVNGDKGRIKLKKLNIKSKFRKIDQSFTHT